MANVGRLVTPAVNWIHLEIGQVNPCVNAHGRGGYVGLRIKALVQAGVIMALGSRPSLRHVPSLGGMLELPSSRSSLVAG